MIKFTLPNYFSNRNINAILNNLIRSNPEYFIYKNLSFKGQEGAIPYSYWSDINYNHTFFSKWPNSNDYSILLDQSYDLPIIFNCANPALLPLDFIDNKMNNILTYFSNGSNQILISNPEFGKILLEKYPFYHLNGSINYQYFDKEKAFVENLQTIKCNFQYLDDNYYQDIPKNKIDVVITTFCKCDLQKQNGCKKINDQNILMFMTTSPYINCPAGEFNILRPEEIIKLNKQGYINFSLDMSCIEMTNYDMIIQIYLNLFIKQEYQNVVKTLLMQGVIE